MGSAADCSEALRQLLQNVTATSVQALDAFGKVPAGILTGNLAWWGDYDECIALDGLKYCLVNLKINASTPTSALILEPAYGVCVPDVCSEEDIINNIENLTSIPDLSWLSLGKPTEGSTVHCQEFPVRQYDAGFICFTIFWLLLLTLMLAGAALDVYLRRKKEKLSREGNLGMASYQTYDSIAESNGVVAVTKSLDENKPLLAKDVGMENSTAVFQNKGSSHSETSMIQEFLLCFAFNRNLRKLMDTKQSNETIGCLNGMRVISISWVALGHIFIYGFYVTPENTPQLLSLVGNFGFQAICNAFLSVDTFFFMSGFLVAYLTLSRMKEMNGKLPVGRFYFHRLWRLTPLYACVILVLIYIYSYFGNGPLWYHTDKLKSNCLSYWWRNLLYINNFFPNDEMCIVWSWYLSNDMQFFIITPILLFPIFRSKMLGLLITIGILLASFIITATLIGYYHMSTNFYGVFLGSAGAAGTDTPFGGDYFNIVYIKPYCRIAPYLVGFILGYCVYRQVAERRKVRLAPATVALGWALASATALAVVYGTYGSFQAPFPLDAWDTTQNVIYGTFSKFAWSLALAWVLVACHYGYGGWVNDFLSWSFWIPLSRLTFSAYLVHALVIEIYYMSIPSPFHGSLMIFSFLFCGVLLLSYGAALVFSLAIEYPFANIEKILLRGREKKMQVTQRPSGDVEEEVSTA